MAEFIELSLKRGGRVSVNVERIISFEEAHSPSAEFCILTLDDDSIFVNETYSEVESLVRKLVS